MKFTAIVSALFFVMLTAAAHHSHGHGAAHGHGHGVDRRALVQEVVTVTTVVYQTVTVGASSSTLPTSTTMIPPQDASSASSPATPAAPSSILPSPDSSTVALIDAANGKDNPYKIFVPVAGSTSVINSCDYPVYVLSAGNPSCEPGQERQLIAAKSTYTEKMRKCAEGGISLKIAKAENMLQPMQFEYTVPAKENNAVYYDISYLDCMKNSNGEQDLSACAGHDGGIQAAGGASNDPACNDYHCIANEWCDKQAYVVPEFGYLPNAPVGRCDLDKGIAFELCAGNR